MEKVKASRVAKARAKLTSAVDAIQQNWLVTEMENMNISAGKREKTANSIGSKGCPYKKNTPRRKIILVFRTGADGKPTWTQAAKQQKLLVTKMANMNINTDLRSMNDDYRGDVSNNVMSSDVGASSNSDAVTRRRDSVENPGN